jgi:hypothetical protein
MILPPLINNFFNNYANSGDILGAEPIYIEDLIFPKVLSEFISLKPLGVNIINPAFII